MNKRTYIVYIHTSPSAKKYIGITSIEVERRWKNGEGYKNQVFYNAIQKYGWDSIEHEIIATNLTKEEAEQMEIELIAKYKSNEREFGYNIENGGNCIGKMSEETKRKISESQTGKNNSNSKRIICDDMIFDCVRECAEYCGEKYSTVRAWLNGQNSMPKEWYDRGLRYEDKKMSDYTVCDLEKPRKKQSETRKKLYYGSNHPRAKKVYCAGMIFGYIKQCAEFYKTQKSDMTCWLNGKRKMPQKFVNLGLRYATEEDIQKYPIYIPE